SRPVLTPHDPSVEIQRLIAGEHGWILDRHLGPYDVVEVRLQSADTIVFLDSSVVRCAWRALRRSQERPDFWRWLLRYRRQSRPSIMKAIAHHAPHAMLHVLRNPGALERFIADVDRTWTTGLD